MKVSSIIVAEGKCLDISLCLSSANQIANEIVIIDIGIDNVVLAKIKSEFPNIKFKKLDKPEYVELIRQESFKYAQHPWILLLDPDEYLSPDLVRYIQQLDEITLKEHTHFKIPRQNYIFGKWMAHSRWWPDYQIRLFLKDNISWPIQLHAQPVLTGKCFIIPAFENEKLEMNARTLVHHNYANVIEYLDKAERYAGIEAQEIVNSGHDFTVIEAMRKATSEFISRFFADKGYKDGMHGFILALLQMFYYVLVFIYYWERKGYPEISTPTAIKASEQLFIKSSKEVFYWLSRDKIVRGKDAFVANLKSKLL